MFTLSLSMAHTAWGELEGPDGRAQGGGGGAGGEGEQELEKLNELLSLVIIKIFPPDNYTSEHSEISCHNLRARGRPC